MSNVTQISSLKTPQEMLSEHRTEFADRLTRIGFWVSAGTLAMALPAYWMYGHLHDMAPLAALLAATGPGGFLLSLALLRTRYAKIGMRLPFFSLQLMLLLASATLSDIEPAIVAVSFGSFVFLYPTLGGRETKVFGLLAALATAADIYLAPVLFPNRFVLSPVETALINLITIVGSVIMTVLVLDYQSIKLTDALSRAHQVALELRDAHREMEERVRARTRDLESTAEIGRMATSIRELNELLDRTVNLIRDRFGFYHAQVFLLDETGEYAVLKASTGEAGRKLLEMGHRLRVGSQSVIGQVTERNEPVVALDTEDAEVVHRPNPILPHTRSEMALPLRVGGKVIGALDVQSTKPRAFTAADVRVFQTMADQLAIAIENARMLETATKRIAEIERLNRLLTESGYREILRRRRADTLGYNMIGEAIKEDASWTPAMRQAFQTGQVVIEGDGPDVTLAAPIKVRGQVVGVAEFEVERLATDEELRTLAEALMDRLSVAVENARLFEESRRLAWREQAVNEISGRLAGATDIDVVLQTAVRELGTLLHARQTAIKLQLEGSSPSPGSNGGSDERA